MPLKTNNNEKNEFEIKDDFNAMYKEIKKEIKLKKKVANILKKYPLPQPNAFHLGLR